MNGSSVALLKVPHAALFWVYSLCNLLWQYYLIVLTPVCGIQCTVEFQYCFLYLKCTFNFTWRQFTVSLDATIVLDLECKGKNPGKASVYTKDYAYKSAFYQHSCCWPSSLWAKWESSSGEYNADPDSDFFHSMHPSMNSRYWKKKLV